MNHSPMFEKLRDRYMSGGCRKDQLKKFVKLGALTAEEYKEITGEPYNE